jgi:ribonuclease D
MAVELNFLKPFFADRNLRKVFHDVKQDMEILQSYGFEINNFYDTQLYEMILSTKENISYQSIVLNYTGKKLKKDCGMSDWTHRPLSKKQLKYATEDVTYLRKVYKNQISKLKQLDREDWLDEEISQLPNRNSLEDSLSEASYPLLYKLLNWREEKSREKKVAPELIAGDRLIKSICKKGIEYIRNLKNSRTLVDDREFLDYAEEVAENFAPEKTQTEKNPVINLLKTLLDIKSQQHEVTPVMIASVKDLIKFVSGDQTAKFLHGWRREIFGNAAIDLLNEKIKLGIKENKVVLYE